jgi:Tol biopolymer transport system component
MKHRSAVAALLCFCVAATLSSACGGSGASSSSREPLAPGDVRFLVATDNRLEEITLSGRIDPLLTLDQNHFILQPSISPDGSKIAFIVELPARVLPNGLLDFGADLYIANRDGTDARPLLAHSRVGEYLEAPAWLDNKTLLVGIRGLDAAAGRSFSRILRVDSLSGSHEVMLDDAAMGALSPDRKALVYTIVDPRTRVEQLAIGDAEGRSPRILVSDGDGLSLFITAAFSPDGSQIAFAAVDFADLLQPPGPAPSGSPRFPAVEALHPFAQDVWLINRDGSGLKRLGDIAENMPSLTWSGDGRAIYVIGPAFLWKLDPGTGGHQRLRESGGRSSIIWLEGS